MDWSQVWIDLRPVFIWFAKDLLPILLDWPFLVFILVIVFRRPIAKRISEIERISTEGIDFGKAEAARVEFQEKATEASTDKIVEIVAERLKKLLPERSAVINDKENKQLKASIKPVINDIFATGATTTNLPNIITIGGNETSSHSNVISSINGEIPVLIGKFNVTDPTLKAIQKDYKDKLRKLNISKGI